MWVQEHNPNTSEAAAQLADDYLQARKSNPLAAPEEKKVRPIEPIVCAKYNKGHKAKDCRVNTDGNNGIKTKRTRRDLMDITCFTCLSVTKRVIIQQIVQARLTCCAWRDEVTSKATLS